MTKKTTAPARGKKTAEGAGQTGRPTTGAEIRRSFLDFMAEKGHTIVPSASLVPAGDKSLLFTN